MTPERRILLRIERELGDWPSPGDVEGRRVAERIAQEELDYANEAGEIPRTVGSGPARVCYYGGAPQLIFSTSTWPFPQPSPPKRRKLLLPCWFTTYIAAMAVILLGYGAAMAYFFWKGKS